VTSILKNAAFGTNNTFSTSFKAFQGYELRLGSALTGTLNWNIGNHTGVGTPTTGTLSGTDNVWIYQGQGTALGDIDGYSNCADPCTFYTMDQGYVIKKNSVNQQTGTLSQMPVGYAQLNDGTNGIEIGQFLFGAEGPHSLEFWTGGTGTDAVRIGLYSAQNSFPVYQTWPQWKTDESYIAFQAATPASVPNEFLKQQHPLLARAAYTQYNSAGVFLYPMIDPASEDTYYNGLVTTASPAIVTSHGCYNGIYDGAGHGCIQDVGTTVRPDFALFVYPGGYQFSKGGGRNQVEWRYSYLTNWLTRGHTGRLMQVKYFEMMAADTMNEHTDGTYTWRSKALTADFNVQGQPAATSSQPASGTCNVASDGITVTLTAGAYFAPWWLTQSVSVNSIAGSVASVTSKTVMVLSSALAGAPLTGVPCSLTTAIRSTAIRSWGAGSGSQQPDAEHRHWWGITDYYFMSGDATLYESIRDSLDDFYLNPLTEQNATQVTPTGGSGNGNTNAGALTLTITSGTLPSYVAVGDPIAVGAAVYNITSISGATVGLTPAPPTATGAAWGVLAGSFNTRSTGLQMTLASRYSQFLAAVGDTTNAPVALQQAKNIWTMQVKPPMCVSGYPAGCTIGSITAGPWFTQGISRTRGVHMPRRDAGITTACNSNDERASASFQESIMAQGIWDLAAIAGASWTDYTLARDLAYGISQWQRQEASVNTGSAVWNTSFSGPQYVGNGVRYYVRLDVANASCDTSFYPIRVQNTTWWPFFVAQQTDGSITSWRNTAEGEIRASMFSQQVGVGTGSRTVDIGGYQLAQLINAINGGGSNLLQTQTITSFVDHADGTYTIGWNTPSSTTALRVKWGTKAVVDWIGFDPVANSFSAAACATSAGVTNCSGDPVTTQPWFSATEASGVPSPVAGGQSMTVNTGLGTGGLVAANFSVKAMAPALGGSMCSGCKFTGTFK
jgi:hypothetical protein